MGHYNPRSLAADEFIDDEEIQDTLRYAQEHKHDTALASGILNRAADCKGLTYREAAVLLECDDPGIRDQMFQLAQKIKQKFYGNRIVLFAPLYLSNYCVNGCRSCP